MMATKAMQSLISANARIRLLLAATQPLGGSVATIRPQDIAGLAQDMACAGQSASELPAEIDDSDLRREMAEYRSNVERLGRILPSVHEWLLAEKTRLEIAHRRLAAAAAWVEARDKTL